MFTSPERSKPDPDARLHTSSVHPGIPGRFTAAGVDRIVETLHCAMIKWASSDASDPASRDLPTAHLPPSRPKVENPLAQPISRTDSWIRLKAGDGFAARLLARSALRDRHGSRQHVLLAFRLAGDRRHNGTGPGVYEHSFAPNAAVVRYTAGTRRLAITSAAAASSKTVITDRPHWETVGMGSPQKHAVPSPANAPPCAVQSASLRCVTHV